MKRMLLLLILPIVITIMPMSARGDNIKSTPHPASAQTAQTASDATVASGVGMQKAQVAIRMLGKPMDVALMIVKSQRHALQIMKPQAQLALVMIGITKLIQPRRLAQASEADIICEM